MNIELLQEIGLSKSQAKAYIALVEKGQLTPPEVAQIIGETRSNTYMILNRLFELALIEKVESSKKIMYQPLNPVSLEQLAEKRRQESAKVEERIKHAMPQLLSYFYSFTEKPGIRLLQGEEGLKEIYRDTLRTKKDIYFLRTPKEVQTFGEDYFNQYKKKRAELGITTYAITQDTREARRRIHEDTADKKVRTWIPEGSYTAPVEMNVYGDKVAFLAYGEDIMGVIIQNPPIAEAMRQVFQLIKG